MHSASIDWQTARDIVEVLNYGMPDGKIKRMRLAKLSNALESKFDMELSETY